MEKAQKRTGNLLVFVLNNKALLLMVLTAIGSFLLTGGKSATVVNLMTVARQISVFAIISIGLTMVLAAGQIDLSIGEIVSLCGISYAMMYHAGVPMVLNILIVMCIGMTCGFINAGLTRLFNLPGFVLTLAMAQIYKGITYLLSDGKTIGSFSPAMKYIGQGLVFGVIPMPFIIMFVMLIVVMIMLNKTIYGRQLIATGGNVEAARVSGIRVNMIRISVMMVTGLCVAIGSIVLTGRVASALPSAGDGYAMDAIAAVVIGGTPMRGGKAKVIGTLFGVILIGLINNMLNLTGVSSFWQWICKGAIIVVAIVLDSLTEKFLSKQKVK